MMHAACVPLNFASYWMRVHTRLPFTLHSPRTESRSRHLRSRVISNSRDRGLEVVLESTVTDSNRTLFGT